VEESRVKSKALLITGCGVIQRCGMLRIPHCVEIGSQLAVRFLASRTGNALLARHITFLPLVLISIRG
jgi:hypothetical protein